MPLVDREELERGMAQMLVAHEVPAADAALVSGELVRAESMGVTSHGVIRVIEYIDEIEAGWIQPKANVRVVEKSGSLAVLDCGWSLGIVAAHEALRVAIEGARESNISAVVTRRCNHVNRLGAYAERAARLGLVCIASLSVHAKPPRPYSSVVPWGGAEARLGTDPIAYGFPATGNPVVADFATSVIPEGKVRAAFLDGGPLPPDAVVDSGGRPTVDPTKFYGPPPGALLPFGGQVGYKGYALGLLAELLGTVLGSSALQEEEYSVNGLFLCVIDPSGILPAGECEQRGQNVVETMRDTPVAPGYDRVRVPGEGEFETLAEADRTNTVEIGDGVWKALLEAGGASHVKLDGAVVGTAI